MEPIKVYSIESTQYELYQAASGDYCVSVERYGEEAEHYNLGSKEDALEFILADYEVEPEDFVIRTFKIKNLNCYVTLDQKSLEEFNIDSGYNGHIADYEEAARYFFKNQCGDLGFKVFFDIEEVEPVEHETCVIFSL